MTTLAQEDREEAAKYFDDDVLHVLFTHHARIHELFERVSSTAGDARRQAFAELTALLKAHETAEEAVVRPITKEAAGKGVAEARTGEENEADHEIAALSQLDVDSDEFESDLAELKQAVTDHAEAEEDEEFPALRARRSVDERLALGQEFLAKFHAAGGLD